MPTTQESLSTAIANVRNYVQFVQSNSLKNYAFTITAPDLLLALGLDQPTINNLLPTFPFQNIRVYLGLDSATSEFKLYLTPVTGNVNLPGYPGSDFILPDNTQGANAYVLDLIYPCPNCCPTDSPLFYQNFL